MNKNYTPGHWEARYDRFYGCWVVAPAGKPEGGGDWAEIAKCDLDEEVDEANARLIAAAPAMAEALEMIVGSGANQARIGGRFEDITIARSAYDRARAALASAKVTRGDET